MGAYPSTAFRPATPGDKAEVQQASSLVVRMWLPLGWGLQAHGLGSSGGNAVTQNMTEGDTDCQVSMREAKSCLGLTERPWPTAQLRLPKGGTSHVPGLLPYARRPSEPGLMSRAAEPIPGGSSQKGRTPRQMGGSGGGGLQLKFHRFFFLQVVHLKDC